MCGVRALPFSLRIFPRSVLRNLSGPDWTQGSSGKGANIQTVIVTGTASNGAVLFTAAEAAFRGMNVIVPVDGMSAVEPYADFSTAYILLNAPSVSAKSTLTKTDMIKF